MRTLLLSIMFTFFSYSESWAFCENNGPYNQCSDLNKVSSLLEQGNFQDYESYLAEPSTFNNERAGEGKKDQIQTAKRFLNAAMEPAKTDPLLAFYVGSVLRKGNWSLEGFSYGHNSEKYNIYRKQIEYFEKSLALRDKWSRDSTAKILGNIYYYGLLDPYGNNIYPETVSVDYRKAAEYYKTCGRQCNFNFISSVLSYAPQKGLTLLNNVSEFPSGKLTDDNYEQFNDAEKKYHYLWAIHRFGMFGVKKDENAASKFYSTLDDKTGGHPLYGVDLTTGEGLFSLYKIMRKDTIFRDGPVSQSIPTTQEAEIEVLSMALALKHAEAAKELYFKYSEGIGVSKDYLQAYSYLNLASGFSKSDSERKDYEKWMAEKASDWQLTSQHVISAQQLSKQIFEEAVKVLHSK